MKNLQINLHPLSVLLLIAAVAYGFSVPSPNNAELAEAINNHAAAIQTLQGGEFKLVHSGELEVTNRTSPPKGFTSFMVPFKPK